MRKRFVSRACAYQEVQNLSFSENFANVINEQPLRENFDFELKIFEIPQNTTILSIILILLKFD